VSIGVVGPRSVQAGLDELRDWATDPTPRVGTGLDAVDIPMNGGMARSEVMMVLAPSSVGKTSFALNALVNNPEQPAIFFSLEMGWRMVASRLVALTSGVGTREQENRLKSGAPLPEATATALQLRNLWCDDTPAQTIKGMSESMEKFAKRFDQPPRVVVIDYAELIGGAGALTGSEAVDKVSKKVRDFTRTWDCSTILLHQVGKGDSDGSEVLSLTSGRFGGHAPMDYVVGLSAPRLERGIDKRKFDDCKDHLAIQLLKNRSGEAHPAARMHRQHPVSLRITPMSFQLNGVS
jgi:KaiC/GvpD/RAD55 family RecA-like ATPase